MAEELLEEENFAAMFEASEKAQESTNRIVEGEIVELQIEDERALVGVGEKLEGILPLDEIRGEDGELTHAVGDSITVMVTGYYNERPKISHRKVLEQAKTVGLNYDYENIKLTNTFDAHRVAKWANTLGLEAKLTDRFMSAYFQEGLNLADSNVLVKLGLEVGLDEKGLKDVVGSNQFADLVREQIQEGRQVGVQGVPFFVLNNKYGVSGAQAEEYFSQVLDQLWKESQQFESIPGSDSGQACTEEGC